MLLDPLFKTTIKNGQLTVTYPDGRQASFGNPATGPSCHIRIADKRTVLHLLVHPRLAFGEAWMDGRIDLVEGTLHELIEVLDGNLARIEETPLQALLGRVSQLFRPLQQYNALGLARKHVAHHYDLSEELYDLFLDKDRQYSCAYFRDGDESLEEAQEKKKQHIAAKMMLEPGQRVLDIGCGWGGMALHLARNWGCEVLGITLSQEQLKVARQRAKAEGLESQVKFELIDYRDVTGPFDRIVSVGMLEHVGARYFGTFYRRVQDLLTKDGVALIHAIGRMEQPGTTNPWLRKYIFPGGYTPALSEMMRAIEPLDLWVTDMEILRLHYAKTLREWHRRFTANRERICEIYDERFCRMWDLYLVGCESSFRHRNQMVFQIQLARDLETVPLTRDYIAENENNPRISPQLESADFQREAG